MLEEVLAGIAERSGLDRQEFLAALQDARYEAALERSNKEAEADGVFGFPFFIYEGQKFWGNDRLEWLVQESISVRTKYGSAGKRSTLEKGLNKHCQVYERSVSLFSACGARASTRLSTTSSARARSASLWVNFSTM